MIESTEAFVSGLSSGSEQTIELVFPASPEDIHIGKNRIAITSGGLQITEILNGDTDLTFGKAPMKELQVYLLNDDGFFNDFDFTKPFYVRFGVKTNSGTEWITLGTFRGTRPEKIRGRVIAFTAHDNMQVFEKSAADWIENLTFPLTLDGIFSSLCAFAGVTRKTGNILNGEKEFTRNPFTSYDYTARECLALIAEAAGGYARFTPEGQLEIAWYHPADDIVLKRTDRFEMNVSEFETPPVDELEVYTSYSDMLNTVTEAGA